jgi:hypothetical protein
VEHARDFVNLGEELVGNSGIRITEIAAEEKEIARLGEGSLRDVQEASLILPSLASCTLRDIRGRGNSRSSKLRHQAKSLVSRKLRREPVDLQS